MPKTPKMPESFTEGLPIGDDEVKDATMVALMHCAEMIARGNSPNPQMDALITLEQCRTIAVEKRIPTAKEVIDRLLKANVIGRKQ